MIYSPYRKNLLNIKLLIMKKLLIILIIAPTFVFAQKCKIKTEKDIEGNVTKTTNYKIIKGLPFGAQLRIVQKNGVNLLNVHFNTAQPENVFKEDRLIFKLENEDIVTLYPTKNFRYQGVGSGYYNSPNYELSPKDLEKLKSSKIITYRITTNNTYVENDVKSKNQSSLMQLLKCL